MKKKIIFTAVLAVCAGAIVVAGISLKREKSDISNRYGYTEQGIGLCQVQENCIESVSDYLEKWRIQDETDIASTFYGCSIAYGTGYDIDVIRCRSEMEDKYIAGLEQRIEAVGTDAEKSFVYDTYYYVMFKQSFEWENIDEDVSDKIICKLDEVMEHLLSADTVDMATLRCAVEIKANLDSYIYRDTLDDIIALLKKLSEPQAKKNSHMIDAVKLDAILRLGIFDRNFVSELKRELYCDGGYCCMAGEQPDLKTTYHMYSLMTGDDDLLKPDEDEIREMKEFLSTIDDNGIYSYDAENTDADLRSVYYGNALRGLEPGGGDGTKL